jgi:hypothetical protein
VCCCCCCCRWPFVPTRRLAAFPAATAKSNPKTSIVCLSLSLSLSHTHTRTRTPLTHFHSHTDTLRNKHRCSFDARLACCCGGSSTVSALTSLGPPWVECAPTETTWNARDGALVAMDQCIKPFSMIGPCGSCLLKKTCNDRVCYSWT